VFKNKDETSRYAAAKAHVQFGFAANQKRGLTGEAMEFGFAAKNKGKLTSNWMQKGARRAPG
jgi:hypothetical protein